VNVGSTPAPGRPSNATSADAVIVATMDDAAVLYVARLMREPFRIEAPFKQIQWLSFQAHPP
jgi:hypothetical protein